MRPQGGRDIHFTRNEKVSLVEIISTLNIRPKAYEDPLLSTMAGPSSASVLTVKKNLRRSERLGRATSSARGHHEGAVLQCGGPSLQGCQSGGGGSSVRIGSGGNAPKRPPSLPHAAYGIQKTQMAPYRAPFAGKMRYQRRRIGLAPVVHFPVHLRAQADVQETDVPH